MDLLHNAFGTSKNQVWAFGLNRGCPLRDYCQCAEAERLSSVSEAMRQDVKSERRPSTQHPFLQRTTWPLERNTNTSTNLNQVKVSAATFVRARHI